MATEIKNHCQIVWYGLRKGLILLKNITKYKNGTGLEWRVPGYRSTGATVFVVMDNGTKTKFKNITGPTDQWKGEF